MSEVSLAELAHRLKPYIVETVVSVVTSPGGGGASAISFIANAGTAMPNNDDAIWIVSSGMLSTSAGGSTITIVTSTPGTLTYATTNDNVPAHKHAITSSFEPGVAPSLLRTGSAGQLFLGVTSPARQAQFVIHPATISTKGQIIEALAGQTANLWQLYDSAGNDLIVVTNDGEMESGNPSFASGVSGWQITPAGDAEFNNIRSRGSIRASVFEYGDIQATAGSLVVAKSAAKLYSDWTSPASLGNSNTLQADNDVSGAWLFAIDDLLRIKTITPTGVEDAWMVVTARTNQGTYTDYTVRLDYGSTSTVFRKGTAIADYGQSGDGAIYFSADGVIGASANISIVDMLIGVVNTVAVSAGGTGYNVDDILTLVEAGSSGDATVKVLTVTSGPPGPVGTVQLLTGGYDYTTGVKATTVAPAGGSGCTINVTDTDNPWEGSQYLKTRLGNMSGSYGTGANDRWGFGVGDYDAGNYISYNAEVPNTFLLKAGNDSLYLDEDGLHFDVGSTYSDQTGVRWHDGVGTVTHYIRALHNTSTNATNLQIRAIGVSPQKNSVYLTALGTGTTINQVQIAAVNASYSATLTIIADSAKGEMWANVKDKFQVTAPTGRTVELEVRGTTITNSFITVGGGIVAGTVTLGNPGTGIIRYTGTLSSRKNSANYPVYGFRRLTTPVRILDVTGGNSVGPSNLNLSSLPNNVAALAVRVVFQDAGGGNSAYYFTLGPNTTNYYAVTCRSHDNMNADEWDENSGIVPCGSVGSPSQIAYRVSGGAGNCNYVCDVYGYFI